MYHLDFAHYSILLQGKITIKKYALLLAICFQAACVSTPSGAAHVDVYKSDGARQCQGVGVSPEAMQTQFNDIKVYAARKDHLRGMMFAAVCGGMMGSVNVYTIDKKALPQAEQLGFAVFQQDEH
ncbi:hypothetical protein ACKLNO_06560 [Neisseriaceae bacterium B1]